MALVLSPDTAHSIIANGTIVPDTVLGYPIRRDGQKRVLLVMTTSHDDIRTITYVDALRRYSGAAVDIVKPTQHMIDQFRYTRTPSDDPIHYNFSRLFNRYDGLVLSGGGPNVTPKYYGGEPLVANDTHDVPRDILSLGIAKQLPTHIPMLTICLGMQHLAVAHGASLGKTDDHWTDGDDITKYRPSHPLHIRHASLLHLLAQTASQVTQRTPLAERVTRLVHYLRKPDEVFSNSLHRRVVLADSLRFAPKLNVMAHAPDGVIEGIHRQDSNHIGVQYHPEKDKDTTPLSRRLFAAFGMMMHGTLNLQDDAQFQSFTRRFFTRQRIALNAGLAHYRLT